MASKDIKVLDSTIHYVETGGGDPIVFLHGNPTSSYLWRNVTPHLTAQGRCLAVDLIGFGGSGKPDIGYRFVDHARYLDGWFDAMGLDRVTLVLHDWGTALGFDWARRHPNRVAGIAFMEALLREMTWDQFPAEAKTMFQAFRTPGEGEKLIIDQNIFVDGFLPQSMMRKLSEEEMAAYRAPFIDPPSRKPVLVWPRELPIEGEPADVCEMIRLNDAYLSNSSVPKLLLTFEPGAIMQPELVEWCQKRFQNLDVRPAGKGLHFVQEDSPEEIGKAIAEWRGRVMS